MATNAIGATGAQAAPDGTAGDAFGDVNLQDFIKLLVAELQNQDPMNPMENSELLQQVSQMQSIESTKNLTDTLESVLLGQNVATASSLLGRTISALTDDNQWIAGEVDRVSIEDGQIRVHVDEHAVKLTNISEILPEGATAADLEALLEQQQ